MLYNFGSITVVPWSVNVSHIVLISTTPSQPVHLGYVPSCPPISSLIKSARTHEYIARPIVDLLTFGSIRRSQMTRLLLRLFLTSTATVYPILQSACTSSYFHLEDRLISGLSAQWFEPIKSPISEHFVVTQRSNWRCILIIESLDCFLDCILTR